MDIESFWFTDKSQIIAVSNTLIARLFALPLKPPDTSNYQIIDRKIFLVLWLNPLCKGLLIKRVSFQRHMTDSTIHSMLKIKTLIPGRKNLTPDL
jgi:hypothetical protein